MTQTTKLGTNGATDHIGYIWLGNGGQISIMTNSYAHSYDSAERAAMDAGELLVGASADGWDGNDEDARIDVKDPAYNANGSAIIHMVKGDTCESVAKECAETGGHAARHLARYLAPALY